MVSNYGNVANILGLKLEEVFIIKEKNALSLNFLITTDSLKKVLSK